MSKDVVLKRCYGVSFDQAGFQRVPGNTEEMLDRVTGVKGDEAVREEARKKLGVEFVKYGYDSAFGGYMLADSSSLFEEHHETLMHIWIPDVPYAANARLL